MSCRIRSSRPRKTPDGCRAVPGSDRYLRHIGYQNCSYDKENASGETGFIDQTALGEMRWVKLEDEFERYLASEKQKAREEAAAENAAKFATLAQQIIADMRKRGLAQEDIEHYQEMLSGIIQPERVAN